MQKLSAVFFLLLVGFLVVISIRLSAPRAVENGPIADSVFNVHKAYSHLQKIAEAPHMVGSTEHEQVKQYVIEQCKHLGFEVRTQDAVPVTLNWGNVQAAYVQNIIAVKKGRSNSKAVLLMAHYDSEPNTSGAGDDGSSVAAMLETARALQKSAPLNNDLVMLFTDGEELGLMGATAFVKDSTLTQGIGLALNFEARGNKGPSNMFEVNENNGWVMSHYAAAAAHPFANSLGYEVYKKLPNSTDFTVFKNAGFTGLNHAFIDGYENYHSPTDIPENLDQRSMQHHGENMLSLVKHFGNTRIQDTKGPDLSYFNALGGWFVHFPASRNIYLVVLVNLLVIYFLYALVKRGHASWVQVLMSFFIYVGVLAAVFFVSKFLVGQIMRWYPMYSHFHDGNSYNNKWYFLSMSLLALALFVWAYHFALKRISHLALSGGIMLVVTVLLDLMYAAIPSAAFLFSIPLLFVAAAQVYLVARSNIERKPILTQMLNFISVSPAICLLAPIIYFTFIAFGLGGNMPMVTVLAMVLVGLIFPVLQVVLKDFGSGLGVLAFLGFSASLLGAHLNAGYDKQHPLQTALRYEANVSTGKAQWISAFSAVDDWTKQFFPKPTIDQQSWDGKMVNDAPLLDFSAPEAVLVQDSMVGENRLVTLRFTASRPNVVGMTVSIADSSQVSALTLNGERFKKEAGSVHRYATIAGNPPGGALITFELPAGRKLEVTVGDKSIGMPKVNGLNTSFPEGIIPSASYGANTVRIKKNIAF